MGSHTFASSCSSTFEDGADQTSRDVTNCSDAEERAARAIQKAYRSHRARRELQGLALAAPSRRFETKSETRSRSSTLTTSSRPSTDSDGTSPPRKHWQRAVSVAIQASVDDDRPSGLDADHDLDVFHHTSPKMMDLQYFLEMVDSKHRHGSNLRAYHNVWRKSLTKENFFYWLDFGEGKALDLPHCPRVRLDKEQVRYLSPEERFDYLVKIDETGLFRWAKNNELVDTDDKRYKDSLHGVVPIDEDAPRFHGYSTRREAEQDLKSPSQRSSSLPQVKEDGEEEELLVRKNSEPPNQPGKSVHHTPVAMYDRFAASFSLNKGTWLFVADASYRIYVGIKEPGTFQHSSFLRGRRISAAGMLKIHNGQLRSLHPLSGHYRPHLANFRAFHHSLQSRGADLSHVSISKSYATLAGIEGYASTKHKVHRMHEMLEEATDKLHLRHLDDPE